MFHRRPGLGRRAGRQSVQVGITMRSHHVLMFFLLFFVLGTTLLPSATAQDADETSFDARITAFMEEASIPGLAIAVIRPGAPDYVRGFGRRSVEDDAPVTERTVFKLNSVSKSMTATAAARLVADGRLQWDDRIIDHYPAFRLQDPFVTREATIEDAMSHRVGVEALDWFEDIPRLSLQDAIARMRYLPQAKSFRAAYLYDNYMFSVGGLAAGAAAGGWADMIEAELFRPVKMKDSLIDFDAYIEQDRIAPCHECSLESAPRGLKALRRNLDIAAPHVYVDGESRLAHWRLSSSRPAGSVWSSARDMARYMALYLNEGRAGNKAVLPPDAIRELTRARIAAPRVSAADQHRNPLLGKRLSQRNGGFYALGWRAASYEGRPLWRHEGASIAYQSAMAVLPEDGVAIAIMANVSHDREGLVAYLAMELVDEFLNLAPAGWVDQRLQTLDAEIQAHVSDVPQNRQPASASDHAPYLGVYRHPAYGEIEITADDEGRLALRQGENRWGLLTPKRRGVFELTWNGVRPKRQEIYFTPGAEGPAAILTLKEKRFARIKKSDAD